MQNILIQILGPVKMEKVTSSLQDKATRGSSREFQVILSGYPKPQVLLERLPSPDGSWRFYTGNLQLQAQGGFWFGKIEHKVSCNDTGLLRLVIHEITRTHYVTFEVRTPLIGK